MQFTVVTASITTVIYGRESDQYFFILAQIPWLILHIMGLSYFWMAQLIQKNWCQTQ